MKKRRSSAASLVVGGLLLSGLLASLLLVRREADVLQHRAAATEQLLAAATRAEQVFERGRELALSGASSAEWQIWRHDGRALTTRSRPGPAQRIAAEALLRALEGYGAGAELLIGPLPTGGGSDAVGLVVAGPGRGTYAVAVLSLEHWFESSGLSELSGDGYAIALDDVLAERAVARTDAEPLRDAVRVDLRIGQSLWRLAAQPRSGWGEPQQFYPLLGIALMLLLVWLALEVQRFLEPRRWRVENELLRTRGKRARDRLGTVLGELATAQAHLRAASYHDELTGLPNRKSGLQQIEHALSELRERARHAATVLAIGFDRLKHVVDSFGPEVTDCVLLAVAERIEAVLDDRAVLCRTAVGQFAVVLSGAPAESDTAAFAARLSAVLEPEFVHKEFRFVLRPRIGIAEARSGYEYPDELLGQAEHALNRALERSGGLPYERFDISTMDETVSRLQLEVDLRRAIEEDGLELHYEPILDPRSSTAVGFEALLRWQHPTDGRVSPGRFLPVAVEAGLMDRLNQWVLRRAVRQAAAWQRAGYERFFINVNVSAESLQAGLTSTLREMLSALEVDPAHLRLEITESALIDDLRSAARILRSVSELGVGIWLDDFGTGYSALSYLRVLPFQGVKLDKSFADRMVTDARDFAFFRSVVNLVTYLGMECVAEGIETAEQHELLLLTDCTYCQGYLFSQALPAEEAAALWMPSPESAPQVNQAS